MRALLGVSLLVIAGAAQAQAAQCGALAAPKALPVRPTVIAPIAPELVAPSHQLGAPTGVLSQAFDEALAVDQVLFRLRLEGCQVAKALPPASPAAPLQNDAASYKPKTQFDNTPWRFDMHQNGKRMTAEEFDAWMKARGVRVAKGAAPAAAPAPEPAKDEAKKK
ncbi:hypothetical protein [Vulcaniibacterium tengchongense]|uniref:Secreted protein n=1 Tax=Vulcaniibacterium tengchongense TaxID=1273429 RepID=A0A3N4VU06_9GAMM|nr:hypothetical protein EDC50_2566 [Vulcaniibacterium tengchongense]